MTQFGDFEFHPDRGELVRRGFRIKLQELPLKLLCLLLERPGEIVSRERIRRHLWGDGHFVDYEHGINTAVLKLRRAIQVRGSTGVSLVTSPGKGYRLVVPDGKHGSWTLPQVLDVQLNFGMRESKAKVAFWGFVDDLVVRLGHTTKYQVRLLTGPPAGNLLLVLSVIEWQSQNRLTARLHTLPQLSKEPLWSAYYSDPLEGGSQVQSLIVSEVTAALSGLDGPVPLDVQNERVIRTLTSSEEIHPEAYEAYLSGRFLFSQRNPQALLEARRQFKQACELSPRFAPAHASLSRTCRFLTIFEMSDPGPMWEEAELYARRAVELDGLLSESQSSLACVLARYRWRWLEGCVAYEEALRLNPSDPETYCDYGVTLLAMGELNEGARCLERALRLDPRYAIARATVGMSRLMAGQQKEGIEMLTQMTEAMPDFLSGWIYLGIGALNAHEPSRAVTAFERTLAIAGEQPTLMSLLAQAYSMQGQSAAAAAAVSKVWEQVGRRYVSPTALAIAAIAVQDCAGALREIAKVVTERDANFALYRKMRLFDAVRHQPEFLQTLVTMGLRSAES